MKHNVEVYNCPSCKNVYKSLGELDMHIGEPHPKKVHQNTILIGDSNLKSVSRRLLEKVHNGKGIFCPGMVNARNSRTYNSDGNWPNAKFKENNYKDIAPQLLKERKYDNIILMAPTSDITNLKVFDESFKYAMAEQSSKNIIKIAENSIDRNDIKKSSYYLTYQGRMI